MHLRRALLLFALILGLTAVAVAVSPSRERDDPTAPPPADAPARPPFRDVVFDVRASGRATLRSARTGEHLLLSVSSAEGGLVTIPRLGLTDSVELDSPAHFDVLAPSPGRYDVLLAPSALEQPRRVGTLLTRP
jgi:hypothetical protein